MKRFLSVVYRGVPDFLTRTILYWASAKFIHGVVGVFRDDTGRVLVLHHVYRKGYPWGFPSGLVKAGEDASNGALRELREETGLEAAVDRIGETTLVAHRHLETVVYGTARSDAAPVFSHEIFEARWVEPANLPGAVEKGLPPDQHRLMMSLIEDKP